MTHDNTDKKWFKEFIIELRLRQVRGQAIGDTVASARELLADTGRSAEDTFGAARDYAAVLELPAAPKYEWVRTSLWPTLLSLIAFLLFSQVAPAWAKSELLLVSPTQLALAAAPVLVVALMPLYLTLAIRHVWLFIPIVAFCAASGIFSALVAPTTADDAWLAISPLPLLVGSFAALVALSILSTVRSRRPGASDDIVYPLPDEHTSDKGGSGFGTTVFTIVTNWLFPLFALVIVALSIAVR